MRAYLADAREAIRRGSIRAIEWSVVLAVVILTISYLLNDYGIVRQRALNGQQAFEFIQQQIAAQKAAPKGTP